MSLECSHGTSAFGTCSKCADENAPPKGLEWESIGHLEWRASIHGGWLVKVSEYYDENGITNSMCFVPDPDHRWDV